MTIGSVDGVLSRAQTVLNSGSQNSNNQEGEATAETAAEEAGESVSVTRKEAGSGDIQAKQKLTQEEQQVGSLHAPALGDAAAAAEGKGSELNTIA
jgi:hypothetical protein